MNGTGVLGRLAIAAICLLLISCGSLPQRDGADIVQRDDDPVQPQFSIARKPPPPAPVIVEEDGLIWSRLRSGYALPLHPERSEVRVQMAWYLERPDFLERVTGRGEPYLHFIVDEIERRGLPAELALLPIVESAFQPFAYSRSRAAGIWQFIPSTGRHFDLKQNWWYDGRRDIHASTHAALDYLTRLHRMFGGDWLLALAAYNAGEGTVSRAVRRNLDQGRPADFWLLHLPAETRAYVPRLLAVSALVAEPDRHGVALWPVRDEPYLETIELDGQIDLAVAAELAGIDLDTMYKLNPGFNRWATDPNGPHRLLLPVASATAFRDGIDALPGERRLSWQRHAVARGDTLSGIAARYDTTVQVLREVNNLSGSMIRQGQHLLIPLAARSGDDYNLSASRRPGAAAVAATPNAHRHVVAAGESLWSISRQYGVTIDELARRNSRTVADPLRVGDRLLVHGGTAGAPRLAAPPDALRTIQYAVRSGDSLWSISRRFQVSVTDIRRWNRIGESTTIRPGQRLTLYVDVTAQDG